MTSFYNIFDIQWNCCFFSHAFCGWVLCPQVKHRRFTNIGETCALGFREPMTGAQMKYSLTATEPPRTGLLALLIQDNTQSKSSRVWPLPRPVHHTLSGSRSLRVAQSVCLVNCQAISADLLKCPCSPCSPENPWFLGPQTRNQDWRTCLSYYITETRRSAAHLWPSNLHVRAHLRPSQLILRPFKVTPTTF